MPSQLPRPLVYLFLAVMAYGIAFVWGRGPGMALFLIGGAAAELLFWVNVFRRVGGGSGSRAQ